MHAWECRYCDARNAPALPRCHHCGADRAKGCAVMPAAYHRPNLWRVGWEMARTTARVAVLGLVWLALGIFGLIFLGGMPWVLALLLLLGGAVWYLARIAGSLERR